MFMLYAIPFGILVGLAHGGSLGRLAAVRLRWAPLILLGLLFQAALFSAPLAGTEVALRYGPLAYVLSTALVLGVLLLNLRGLGAVLLALGGGSNLLVMIANGGQ